MIDPHWVFVSAALGVIGSVHYSLSTVRGRVRPNLVTWSMWAAAPLIGFFAQLDSGVGLPAVPTLAAGVGPLTVVATGLITRHNLARLGLSDLLCAVISVITLAFWLGLKNAPLAVFLAVMADATAALPTIRKAWREPDSENLLFYVLVGVGATLTLLTITTWEPTSWAFAAYMLALSVLLVGIVSGRRHAELQT